VQRNERAGCVDLIDIGNWEVALCAAGGPQRGDDSGRVGRRNERSEAGRKFRFDESKTSQAEIKKKDKPNCSYTSPLSPQYLSLLFLFLLVTRLCPRLPPHEKTTNPRGAGEEERGKGSRECAPQSPFAPIGGAASREIRSAYPAAARARWLEVSAALPPPPPIGAAGLRSSAARFGVSSPQLLRLWVAAVVLWL
jgi:hypothetical protein